MTTLLCHVIPPLSHVTLLLCHVTPLLCHVTPPLHHVTPLLCHVTRLLHHVTPPLCRCLFRPLRGSLVASLNPAATAIWPVIAVVRKRSGLRAACQTRWRADPRVGSCEGRRRQSPRVRGADDCAPPWRVPFPPTFLTSVPRPQPWLSILAKEAVLEAQTGDSVHVRTRPMVQLRCHWSATLLTATAGLRGSLPGQRWLSGSQQTPRVDLNRGRGMPRALFKKPNPPKRGLGTLRSLSPSHHVAPWRAQVRVCYM